MRFPPRFKITSRKKVQIAKSGVLLRAEGLEIQHLTPIQSKIHDIFLYIYKRYKQSINKYSILRR